MPSSTPIGGARQTESHHTLPLSPHAEHLQQPRTFDLPFPISEYEQRHARVQQAMEHAEVDIAIVTAPRDFHWPTLPRYIDFTLHSGGLGNDTRLC